MCSNVFMGNTKHITVRMPESLVEVIDGRAEREKRSRSQVVVLGLQSEFGVSAEGVKSGSGELETQQAAVVDRLSASRPTLKVSNPSSPTKIYVEGVKGERDVVSKAVESGVADSGRGRTGKSVRSGVGSGPGKTGGAADHGAERKGDAENARRSSVVPAGDSSVGETDPVKLCAACETACVISKGFWACPDVTCGRYGQQQGRVQ